LTAFLHLRLEQQRRHAQRAELLGHVHAHAQPLLEPRLLDGQVRLTISISPPR
jgi:hypothetical protein